MTLTAIKKLCLTAIVSCVALMLEAQPVNYTVQPTKKTYSKFRNPLIKNTPMEVLVINGEAYLDGDIYVGKVVDLDKFQSMITGQSVTSDATILTARWDNGIVPFVVLDGFTDAEEAVIINAMNHIAERTNVCFRPRTTETSYIKFKKYTKEQLGFSGGSSWLGRCQWPMCGDGQEIKLSSVSNRVVRHEIGHALGLAHEQNREDRNNAVQIITDNIQPLFVSQFIQNPYTTTDVGTYDFNSIMHYHSKAFGKDVNGNALQTIRRISNPTDDNFGLSSVLSTGDILGINSMYPGERTCATLFPLAPGEVNIGTTKTFTVYANKLHNTTGMFVRAGQKYELATTNRDWKNGLTSTDCSGYEGNILDVARRHPDLKMMSLIGEVFTQNNTTSYSGTYFNVGCGKTWTATKTGYLVFLANDNAVAYGDNSGSLTLTVKRIE